jgi:hypothetical protein
MRKFSIFCLCFSCVSVSLLLGGCGAALRNKQLESVAKDWSLVIRASQVIPVYPLSEDVQPGDALLVSTPVARQADEYKKKGFLPLDQLYLRMNPDSKAYDDFYNSRYKIKEVGKEERNLIPPGNWQQERVVDDKLTSNWSEAPHVAFPSYSFKVDSGVGAKLAIPIQGIPFALGLMHSSNASGSVTISKAVTYGLDNFSLETKVRDWALANRDRLLPYRPATEGGKERRYYLRVISRVYLASEIEVTINNDEATGAQLGGGSDQKVDLLTLKDQDAAENYGKTISALNDAIDKSIPGGKVKVAAASSRSVSLNQKFDHPLVIGYVGFDLPILKGGRLGSPVSTLELLTGREAFSQADSSAGKYRLAALAHMNLALEKIIAESDGLNPKDDARRVKQNLDSLSSLLPETYSFTLYHKDVSNGMLIVRKDDKIVKGAMVAGKDFQAVCDFYGNAQATVSSLKRFLESADSKTDPRRAELEEDLKAARSEIERLGLNLAGAPELAEAVDLVFFGL